ncbi:TetR/AcrR family transcriptional regulator [Actinomadura sp. HBU206391]|uniref:TetR/AcrR family transcriptional regulator n=1 Tax=Actinomadura sp. HBU206391 TaxID=2731692 RepID=UPI001650C5B8|nr:TetR/AcrR family transcriptional regulator [Actinomadura sp. HBU206391]MBC6461589.1 TetR/AcrR family transcriptional regulator [Actinomadura sp. HBU206391]
MTETTEPLCARPPGRPRSERAEKAIIEATLDLLVEEAGVAGVSIEAVAARAGVGKTTIYRRWPNKEALIVDAVAALKAPLPELPGRSVREDLIALTRAVRSGRADRRIDCVWNVIGSRHKHPELASKLRRDVIEPRREVMRGVLRRGVEAGELRPDLDVEMALSVIVGAMTMQVQALAPDEELADDVAERVVDTAMRGFAA